MMKAKRERKFLIAGGLLCLLLGIWWVSEGRPNSAQIGREETAGSHSRAGGQPGRRAGEGSLAATKSSTASLQKLTEIEWSRLDQAVCDLRGFIVSGRGISGQTPYEFGGEFPRAQLLTELDELGLVLREEGVLKPILLENGLAKEELTDEELIVTVRVARRVARNHGLIDSSPVR